MEITHFTQKAHIENIKLTGFIELEGFNIEKQASLNPNQSVPHSPEMNYEMLWLSFKKQFRATGRYVWFTEEISCSCISKLESFEKVAIKFNAEEIRAERWESVADRVMFKSNKAKQLIRKMNNSAILSGDDISKWWVCRERVDLKFGKIEENLNPE